MDGMRDGTTDFSREELQLATRNHGMPLEALRYPITPVGLHYLLTHFDIPAVDPDTWRLEVGGSVARPLTLTMQDLRARPAVTVAVTMECAGNGRAQLDPRPISQPWVREAVGTGEWTGTPLGPLLREAGLEADALEVVFAGADRGVEGGLEHAYERSLTIEEALREELLLVYALEGRPLPPQHGFPLRLLVPGWYGMTSVKWLHRITVATEPFAGYQQSKGYRYRMTEDEPGTPVTRIVPRALMVPPGIPDFLTRNRVLSPGPCVLEGRAWSGWGPIELVEVSADGGDSWEPAALGEPPSPFAWYPWSFEWVPGPGVYELCCRARDATGRDQPLTAPWNLGGYSNNEVQRITVLVDGA
jgi:DMSO/TMAO reductase YedYZ molybdopterin-dependent catalytic subunit